MPTFALILTRRPPSFNRGPNRFFQEAIRGEARRRFAGNVFLTGELYVRILWFHRQPTTQDVDNIAKNILDALKGVVFGDDVDVTQCLACKIDLGTNYVLENRNAPASVLDELLPLLDLSSGAPEDVLYVEVGVVTQNRVALGPIDGGLT